MSLPRIVVDNSAILPAFFAEKENDIFNAGLVTNRARALVNAIRMRRVDAFVPPSFYREFLNVSTRSLYEPGGRTHETTEAIREQWEDLLLLGLIPVRLDEIVHHSGILVFEDSCPAADAWYIAAAIHANARLWISHEHRDGLVAIAKKHVDVRLLSDEAPKY